jgi:hypothetical protein
MTCKHGKNDPACGSHPSNRYRSPPAPPEPKTPDASRFDIEELEEVGPHLVVKVRYPNCSSCAYEGQKVLVFFNCTCKQAAMWRKLDPHFRDAKKHVPSPKVAPPPDARFPASVDGWKNAIAFARTKE